MLFVALLIAVGATGCGGGGGGGSPQAQTTVAPPTDGAYAWALKAEGPTGALKFGLSLVHPQVPAVEFVIEPPNASVTDAKVVTSGNVDATGQAVGALRPYALLYVVGGDVRRVPLQANGRAPAAQVVRAGTSSACRIVLDANDYAQPEASRYIVSTAGADGQCGSGDDGRAEVRLDAALGLVYTPLASNPPLAALRDPVTLSPRGWVGPRSASFWSTGSTVTLRDAGALAIDRVVSGTFRSVVAESASGLSLIDFPGGDVFTETPLASVRGGGWQAVGYDAGSHYLYRNVGTAPAATWEVLKVSRLSPAATRLASGAGEIALASLGSGVIYVSVFGNDSHLLLSVSKAAPASPVLLESAGRDALLAVTTSKAGVHQLWRVTGVGSTSLAYAIEMIDESFNKLHSVAAGGFPLGQVDPASIDFNASENRSRFLFATGYGARAFADAAVVGYDAATRSATAIGSLPGAASFGSDIVYANVVFGPTPLAAGFVGRSTGGVIQAAGAALFSFDASSAGSLRLTSSQQ